MSALFRGTGAASFDRLYRRHAATVYRYVYAVLGNHADAEDVTQQTFMNAFRAIARGTKPRKAENWLLTIAHNEVRRHFRKTHGRALEVALDDRLAHPAPERSDPSLADVLRALQHLPPDQRAALVMREFEGRSYAEMAQILNVTQHALEGLIFRARRALAEHLEGALTCPEAEEVLLRRLDRRLARPEARRLRDHLRECPTCVRFANVQKRQRSLLKGLSVLPIPASLYAFRGEQAAMAAAGLGAGTAAGGTAAVGGGGALTAAAAAGASGLVVKVAAVTASAAVVGGVGYGVTTGSATVAEPEPKVSHAAAVDQTRQGRRATEVKTALARGDRPVPARPASAQARRTKVKRKRPPAPSSRRKELGSEKKEAAGRVRGREQATPRVTERPTRPGSRKPAASGPDVVRPERGKKSESAGRAETKRPQPMPSMPEQAGPKPAHEDPAASPPSHPQAGLKPGRS
ncbi:MAG TPA: sigma-70 family RNA polymerase sigma factor [Gaiellaceae bacterium]